MIDTHTIWKTTSILVDVLFVSMILWDAFKMREMRNLIEDQQTLLEFQHTIIRLAANGKQEKCYGSTSDSKPESQGSTPCSCATIMKELDN